MKYDRLILTSVAVLTSGLALVACSSAPQPNGALTEAHQAYAAASGDPVVQKSAPRELENAADSLDQAQTAWKDNEDKATVYHFSYMARRYSEIAQQAAKVRTAAIQATTAARVLTLSDMLFATGRSELNGDGMQAVGQLATFLQHYPDRTVTIMGYTDSTGSARINATLSELRAGAVQNALMAQGIDASRIEAHGFGPANPVASNGTAEGRQQNRRVEVAISGQAAAVGVGTTAPK